MLPTKEQEIELRRCFEAARIAYNFANGRIRNDNAPVNKGSLKADWVRANPELKAPTQGVASRIMNRAIWDLVDAYATNYAKISKGKGRKFEVKNRDAVRSRTEIIHIERRNMLHEVVPPADSSAQNQRRSECGLRFGNNLEKVGPIRIQGRRRGIEKVIAAGKDLPCDAKIQWDKNLGAFYFIWVDDVPFKTDPDPLFKDKCVVSLDPGCSPFQQWYSPTTGEFGELLVDARQDLKAHCQRIDSLCSRLRRRDLKQHPERRPTKKAKHLSSKKQRRKRGRAKQALRKKMRREHRRLQGNVQSAHYHAAKFLLSSFDIIIAPVLNTGRLTEKGNRRIFGSRMARALYTWSHRLFRQRLASAAHQWGGKYVFECCEPGTSKTCTDCGAWKQDLRLGDKVYHCPRCGISVDRQLAGARNNFFAAYGMAVRVGWDGMPR